MGKTVHYVFSTYKRKQALDDWIAEELTVMFDEICKEKGFGMICQNVLVDHVHMLIKKKSTDHNEYVMKMIKGISSHRFFEKHPGNRCVYRKLWSRGYRAREIKGEEDLWEIIAYIKGQKIDGIDKRMKSNWKPRRLVSGFQFVEG
ncbi:MAG: IS200/IS605 family transposase [Candidatus Saganbacteria bacterium]|nr:IS200/IS605 family transposase [Candidatus Saganbacteria bacterium]